MGTGEVTDDGLRAPVPKPDARKRLPCGNSLDACRALHTLALQSHQPRPSPALILGLARWVELKTPPFKTIVILLLHFADGAKQAPYGPNRKRTYSREDEAAKD